jgi:hypothetical protein
MKHADKRSGGTGQHSSSCPWPSAMLSGRPPETTVLALGATGPAGHAGKAGRSVPRQRSSTRRSPETSARHAGRNARVPSGRTTTAPICCGSRAIASDRSSADADADLTAEPDVGHATRRARPPSPPDGTPRGLRSQMPRPRSASLQNQSSSSYFRWLPPLESVWIAAAMLPRALTPGFGLSWSAQPPTCSSMTRGRVARDIRSPHRAEPQTAHRRARR